LRWKSMPKPAIGHYDNAAISLTSAATTRQPCGKRTHACVCRPTLAVER
jgi:hypothetical protein